MRTGNRISDVSSALKRRDEAAATANLQFAFFILQFAICVFTVSITSRVAAQIKEEPPAEERVRYGEPTTIGYRVGVEVTASRGSCRNIVTAIAVPWECPEQEVKVISEDFSAEVANVDYRILDDGVKQMIVTIPRLANGATARAIVNYEVTTKPILPLEKTDDLVIPKRLVRKVRQYVGGSPFIETKHQKIRALAKEIWADLDESTTDWQKVEAIYDYVLDHIDYVEGNDKSALETLRDGHADCQGRSALFIALCRINKIPARMVWVADHAFPEFYLEDADGHGTWFPCESAGTRAFGEMPLTRTIYQKGDNFEVPERPKERLRYASDYGIGIPDANGGGKPKVRFVRDQVTVSQKL